MLRWKLGIIWMATVCLLNGSAWAQESRSLEKRMKNLSGSVEQLRAELRNLSKENRELRDSNAQLKGKVERLEADTASARDGQLETQIAALVSGYQEGGVVTSAANPITMNGEFRMRAQSAFGDPSDFAKNFLGIEEFDGYFVDSLVRLGIEYEFQEEVRAYVELQAHWAWGSEASTVAASTGAVGLPGEPTTPVRLHQAYINVGNVFNMPELSLRMGRQEMPLGRQFQFGVADWYNGFSFDVFRARWNDDSVSVDAIAGKLNSIDGDFNQFPSFLRPHDDDELYSVYFTLKTIENHELDVYWIYLDAHGSAPNGLFTGPSGSSQITLLLPGSPFGGTAYYHTLGARIGGVFPDVAQGLDWNVEGAFQVGKADVTGGDDDLEGWTVEAEVGLTLSAESKLRIYSRFLYAAEDWIVLYANRHTQTLGGPDPDAQTSFRARYGLADFIPMSNVMTLQGGIHFDPDPAWTLGATVLWATAADTDAFGVIDEDDDYGWEVDVWAQYRHNAYLSFGLGLAIVFPDDGFETFPTFVDGTHVFAYLQAHLLF